MGAGGQTAGGFRPAGVDGRGPAVAADHPDGEGPGEAAAGDRGADVRPGQPAPDIAHLFKAGKNYVRDVIHAFNDRLFDALDPNGAGAHRDGSMSRPVTGSASSPGATPTSSVSRSPAGRWASGQQEFVFDRTETERESTWWPIRRPSQGRSSAGGYGGLNRPGPPCPARRRSRDTRADNARPGRAVPARSADAQGRTW